MSKFSEIVSQIVLKATSIEQDESRFIIGIVGIPASGKTTLALNLCQAANEAIEAKLRSDGTITSDAVYNNMVQVVPMDGYHLSRDTLTNRTTTLPESHQQSMYTAHSATSNDEIQGTYTVLFFNRVTLVQH